MWNCEQQRVCQSNSVLVSFVWLQLFLLCQYCMLPLEVGNINTNAGLLKTKYCLWNLTNGGKERDIIKILDSGSITLYSKMLKNYLIRVCFQLVDHSSKMNKLTKGPLMERWFSPLLFDLQWEVLYSFEVENAHPRVQCLKASAAVAWLFPTFYAVNSRKHWNYLIGKNKDHFSYRSLVFSLLAWQLSKLAENHCVNYWEA